MATFDPQGLLIPQEASNRTRSADIPIVEPHLWSYRQLLKLGEGYGQLWEGEPASSTLCDWLGECAEPVRQLFGSGQRLAQEHVGWEFLNGEQALIVEQGCELPFSTKTIAGQEVRQQPEGWRKLGEEVTEELDWRPLALEL